MSKEELEEKRKKRKGRKGRKKKVKKKKAKRDACYHKVRARYDVWPSAYASGALVRCRKVGAKNWGNKSKKKRKNESMDRKDIKRIEDEILDTLEKEGGAANMDPLKKAAGVSASKVKDVIDDMEDVGQHEDSDYIADDGDEINVQKEEMAPKKMIKVRIIRRVEEGT